MADTVATRTLHDGPRNVVQHFLNQSDGTGESAVVKVDVSTFSPAATRVRIDKIDFATEGMAVDILWDATTPVLAVHLPRDMSVTLDYSAIGGLINPKATGWTGDIKFTTMTNPNGGRYSITLHMKKQA